MRKMAGAVTLGNIASAMAVRAEEASIVEELKSGSEEAYAWLIAHYHQPVYSLIYRIVSNQADAADTTRSLPESVSRYQAFQWLIQPENVALPHCHTRGFQPEALVVPAQEPRNLHGDAAGCRGQHLRSRRRFSGPE